MKLRLALNESRKTDDSSDVVTPPLVLELQSFESCQNVEEDENRVQFRSSYCPFRL